MKKLAYAGLGLVFLCFDSAFPGEVCTGGIIAEAQPILGEQEPGCPPASCVDACVGIPASSKKTGDTVSIYPDPNKAFTYRLNREGAVGAIQKYCYTLKSWSAGQQRSYSLCVQYKDE